MNTTPVPQSQRSTVHRDGRHFKLVFAKTIKYDDVCEWIVEELGFKYTHIDSVMFKSLKLYEVEAKTEAIATAMKEKIRNLRSRKRLTYDVGFEDYAPALTPLTVMGVPKVFPDSALQKLISEKLKTKVMRSSADTAKKYKWYTGKRMYYVDTAILKAANIPDSIAWNNGEWVFYLSYPGQERKCRKCGNVGHYAKTCENKRETPSPSDENDSEGNSERDDKSVTSEISDVNSVGGSDMNGQNVGDVITVVTTKKMAKGKPLHRIKRNRRKKRRLRMMRYITNSYHRHRNEECTIIHYQRVKLPRE